MASATQKEKAVVNTIPKFDFVLKDVPLIKMRVSDNAQRVLIPEWVDKLLNKFDPAMLGYPHISVRDSNFFIVDGQHRIEALKRWLGDWEKQSLTCAVHTGLTAAQEARLFLQLNDRLVVNQFQKFKVAVTEGRKDECDVKRVVEKCGLHVSMDKSEGSVSAVSTLLKVYRRADGLTLSRALVIAHQAFGDPGLVTTVIDGVARVCERYNGLIDDKVAIERLNTMRGGVGALTARAGLLRKQTGVGTAECFAAAVVDSLNGIKGGKKLPSWWKE